jgi:hypothetical protein
MTTKIRVSKNKKAPRRFILLDTRKGWVDWLGKDRVLECKRDKDIANALNSAPLDSLWISSNSKRTESLLRLMTHSSGGVPGIGRQYKSLIMLEAPKPNTIPFLRSLFREIMGESVGFQWLPLAQLAEVLGGDATAASDLFIGGVIDTDLGLLNLVRGNFERITVPLSIFRASGTSTPDFSQFELDDYGHTVRFGEYEASAHFILYEVDSEYRTRTKKRQRAEDKSLGASLRRLRILKGVPQTGFAGINAKTIGRIESGLVAKPHGTTLATISKTLGVAPENIESY